jgi:poly-gamma-glutamate biosynthesis protein PgsC/CapC
MADLLTVSIALGLGVSLVFSELLGLAAGGLIVPGYFALALNRPVAVLVTLAVAYLTWFIVNALSTVVLVYGRRRTVLMILVSFLLGWFVRSLEFLELGTGTAVDLSVIGYIIPGLIAIWIDRQGLLETTASLITSSVIVRLLLILVMGGDALS